MHNNIFQATIFLCSHVLQRQHKEVIFWKYQRFSSIFLREVRRSDLVDSFLIDLYTTNSMKNLWSKTCLAYIVWFQQSSNYLRYVNGSVSNIKYWSNYNSAWDTCWLFSELGLAIFTWCYSIFVIWNCSDKTYFHSDIIIKSDILDESTIIQNRFCQNLLEYYDIWNFQERKVHLYIKFW